MTCAFLELYDFSRPPITYHLGPHQDHLFASSRTELELVTDLGSRGTKFLTSDTQHQDHELPNPWCPWCIYFLPLFIKSQDTYFSVSNKLLFPYCILHGSPSCVIHLTQYALHLEPNSRSLPTRSISLFLLFELFTRHPPYAAFYGYLAFYVFLSVGLFCLSRGNEVLRSELMWSVFILF